MKITNSSEEQAKCTAEIVQFLHQVWLLNEQGQLIQPDPFYERNEKLTKAVIDDVLTKLEDVFTYELINYRSYHNTAQGISAGEKLIGPGFDKYPPEQKLAIVQGIDRIFLKFKIE